MTTPVVRSHAQYVRLTWSVGAGHPGEQPSIVAERYAGGCDFSLSDGLAGG